MQHAYGLEIPETIPELVNPKHCALIVYDMQIGVVRQIKDGAAITARVKHVLDLARTAGMRVFYTRHLSLPKQLMGAFQFRQAMSWQRVDDPEKVQPWFLRDSPAFQIVSELEALPSEAVFDKLTMSAFEGTALTLALRDCGIRRFLIVGVATEIGIDITCRHGADLGFVPILVRDACGAGHQEAADSRNADFGVPRRHRLNRRGHSERGLEFATNQSGLIACEPLIPPYPRREHRVARRLLMIQPKAVALLLERGASVNAIDRNGGLPLQLAGGRAWLDDCLNRLPTQAERNWNEISMGLIS